MLRDLADGAVIVIAVIVIMLFVTQGLPVKLPSPTTGEASWTFTRGGL